MNSDNPTEYITLRKGNQENYSLFYSKRATDVTRCENGKGIHDESIHYGTTRFNKVRININTLQIVDDDFEFSQTVGRPQKYATGGDCYSNSGSCPQGDFFVNLEGTGFRIRTSMTWDANGTNSTIEYIIMVTHAPRNVLNSFLLFYNDFSFIFLIARQALSESESAVWRLLRDMSANAQRHLLRRSMNLRFILEDF
jgi:hypothetical protein